MYMVAVVMVMEVSIVMGIIRLVSVTLAVDNLGQITNVIMPTDTNLMLHGELGAMALDKITEVLEVEKVLS
tara:strand:- start:11 stop:223 length:213 start_codon:yes stop_codon:yes gene_type:complete